MSNTKHSKVTHILPHNGADYQAAHAWAVSWIASQQIIADAEAAAGVAVSTSTKDFCMEFARLHANGTKASRKLVFKGLRASGAFNGVTESAVKMLSSRAQLFANLTKKQQASAINAANFTKALEKHQNRAANKPAEVVADTGEGEGATLKAAKMPKTPDDYVVGILELAHGLSSLKCAIQYQEFTQAVIAAAVALQRTVSTGKKLEHAKAA